MYQIDFHKPLSIHFIGIGGISMSGLAEILLEEGFTISGSDSKKSPLTSLLFRWLSIQQLFTRITRNLHVQKKKAFRC